MTGKISALLMLTASVSTPHPLSAQSEQRIEQETRESAFRQRITKAQDQGDWVEVARLYGQSVAQTPPAIQTTAGPLLWQGQALQKAQQHEAALQIFDRLMALPAEPGARPPGMLPGPLDLRGEAQWARGHSLSALHRYAEALAAYQSTKEKYFRGSTCTPDGTQQEEQALAEGRCLEHLNRHAEALTLYWQAAMQLRGKRNSLVARRLIELYEAAHQSPILAAAIEREKGALEAREQREWDIHHRTRPPIPPMPNDWFENSVFAGFERLNAMRALAKAKQWQRLLDFMAPAAEFYDGRDAYLLAEAAAWALSEHPQQTIPLLKRVLDAPETPGAHWIYRTLSLSGEAGRKALNELTPTASPSLQRRITDYQTGQMFFPFYALDFPSIPKNLKLPTVLEAPKVL